MSSSTDKNIKPRIPSWLTEKNRDGSIGVKASGTHFIAKTLHHFSEVFENEFFCERYADKAMLLQIVDPRIKFWVLLVFMVFSAFSSNIAVLLLLAFIALLYAKLSGLDMKDYVRRAWAYIPVVVFIFSIPGASSLFVKGTPLFYVLRPGFPDLKTGLYFSAAGIEMAFRLALRPGISLSFGFLLLLTTRWTRITGALASMRVPLIFISILNMAYRYIFVMSEMAGSMIEARSLRTVGKLATSDNRKFMSHSIAHLFVRSHFLSEEIYDAMVCRGFDGRPVSMEAFKVQAVDILFVVINLILLLVLVAGAYIF
jgi:cobalt ABC transporter, permease protein CbiQ